MHCPFCSHSETKVADSRLTAEGRQVRRRVGGNGVAIRINVMWNDHRVPPNECDVTRDHCLKSNGGLAFESYEEFSASLKRLLGDAELRMRLGEQGREYMEREYSWDSVTGRFFDFLRELSQEPLS